MRRVLRDNGLSITMFSLFLVFLVAQSIAGHRASNSDNEQHQQPRESYVQYVTSGAFVEATFENWESEFLQMGAYVALTALLIQKGSPESKKPDGDDVDADPREQPDAPGVPGPVRRGGLILSLYEHSLSLALFGLFAFSLVLHALGGHAELNQQQVEHGASPVSLWSFVTGSRFWFQSMQNWQSEFLAVAALTVLGIFLRQRGSPESKPVAAPHNQTGSG
jgi:heme exporter protein D